MYRKANEAKMILSTLPPWLKAIINARVAEATHHTRMAPTLKELWDFLEHRFHEYDPSRADERWRALTPRVVKGQVTLIHLEDFYALRQRLLPLSNETRPHVIREQLLSKLPWIKEKSSSKRLRIAQTAMWWILVALTLRRVAPHSKKNSGNIALKLALRFLRLFPIRGRG